MWHYYIIDELQIAYVIKLGINNCKSSDVIQNELLNIIYWYWNITLAKFNSFGIGSDLYEIYEMKYFIRYVYIYNQKVNE